MKMKRILGMLLVIMSVTMISCTNEEEMESLEISSEDIEIESTAEAIFDDLDNVTDEAIVISSLSSGRLENRNIPDCAVVTTDEAAGVITVDFGDGCEGRNGVVKKGKIIISYSGERSTPGAFRTVTFENYYVDSLHIEGTRAWVNISTSEGLDLMYSISLTGGQITFADGTFMSREASHTRTFFISDATVTESTLFGGASGINLDGLAYSHTIDSAVPLLFTSDCRLTGVKTPVSGIVNISVEGESEKTVDFGNGACDNIATITQDGTSEEVEVNAKRRRRGFATRRKG